MFSPIFFIFSCLLSFIVLNSKDLDMTELTILEKMRVIREAVTRRCSVKKVFLKILQNLEGNTSTRVCFLIKLHVAGHNVFVIR